MVLGNKSGVGHGRSEQGSGRPMRADLSGIVGSRRTQMHGWRWERNQQHSWAQI